MSFLTVVSDDAVFHDPCNPICESEASNFAFFILTRYKFFLKEQFTPCKIAQSSGGGRILIVRFIQDVVSMKELWVVNHTIVTLLN